MVWPKHEVRIEFQQELLPGHHRLKHLLRCAIIVTVLGEVVCLLHFGVVARDWAAAYAIGATWIKDNLRKWFLE